MSLEQGTTSTTPAELEDTTGNNVNDTATTTSPTPTTNDLVPVESRENGQSGPVRRVSSNSSKPSDLQWKQSFGTGDESLVPGLSNEDVWLLVRRFNKQIYCVKAAAEAPQNELDLNRAEDEQFPPEKLRLTVERFYTSVIAGLASIFKHIARLRSWKEPRRTSVFCAVYFVAWLFDLLSLTFLGFFVSLVLLRRTRPVFFPPPPARDSQVESQDSVTGAPERHKGEAAELEANELFNNFANAAVEGASGVYGQNATEDSTSISEEPSVPSTPATDTASITTTTTATTTTTTTEPTQMEDTAAEDKMKKPVKKKVATATNKTMRVLSDITDIYERFANILSPTTPFLAVGPRLRLVGILVSVCLASHYTSNYLIVKASGFAVGLGFFGDPVFRGTLDFLNRRIPNWKEYLDLQKTLLKGAPTNAQLTLTLLRVGEMSSTPLPPPPSSKEKEPDWPLNRKKSKPFISNGENGQIGSSFDSQSQKSIGDPPVPGQKSKRRFFYKLLKFVRRTVTTAVKGHMAVDRAMAIVGSTHTRSLIDTIRKRGWISAPYGPLTFEAKFERKRGTVVIDSSMEPPVLYFTTYHSVGLDDLRLETKKERSVLFHIPVTDIRELRKTEGLGWKRKAIVELTAGSKEAAGGLVVVGSHPGQHYQLTGMSARNQLFNRLVAIDAQFWESR